MLTRTAERATGTCFPLVLDAAGEVLVDAGSGSPAVPSEAGVHGTVPRRLALVGLSGGAAPFAGSAMEVHGYAVVTAVSVPGGMFGVSPGLLLITRGFTAQGSDGADRAGPAEIDLRSGPTALSGLW